jgi:hypothetical protein
MAVVAAAERHSRQCENVGVPRRERLAAALNEALACTEAVQRLYSDVAKDVSSSAQEVAAAAERLSLEEVAAQIDFFKARRARLERSTAGQVR